MSKPTMNARWLDPETGRFQTMDPIRDGVHWFMYVSNNPASYTDPTGLAEIAESQGQYRYVANNQARDVVYALPIIGGFIDLSIRKLAQISSPIVFDTNDNDAIVTAISNAKTAAGMVSGLKTITSFLYNGELPLIGARWAIAVGVGTSASLTGLATKASIAGKVAFAAGVAISVMQIINIAKDTERYEIEKAVESTGILVAPAKGFKAASVEQMATASMVAEIGMAMLIENGKVKLGADGNVEVIDPAAYRVYRYVILKTMSDDFSAWLNVYSRLDRTYYDDEIKAHQHVENKSSSEGSEQ